MKIAFIVNQFPKLSETFILNQITGLIDMGHEVEIFAGTKLPEQKVHREVEEYQLLARTYYFSEPKQRWARQLKAVMRLLRTFPEGPWMVAQSFIIAKRFKLRRLGAWKYVLPFLGKRYDIIHCQFGVNGLTGIFLKELGITKRVVVSFRGYDISKVIAINERIYNDLFERADLVMPNCDWIRDKLRSLGCKEQKIIVHRSGVDVPRFKFKQRYVEDDGNINLLTVGRLVEKKGVEYSLQAVARLMPKYPGLSYWIAGDGSLRPELETLARQLGLEKTAVFLGEVDHHEVARLMMAFDIFILSSVTAMDGDEEGIPNTLKEALASGMPVISTFHGGIPELVTDGESGFLVPEGDVDALAKRLDYLIQHPELWPKMGWAGRQFVEEHFSVSKLNEKLVEIYHALLTEEIAFDREGEACLR